MSEQFIATPENSEINPLDLLKKISKEKETLQREVVINQPLITDFVDYIVKQYPWEEIQAVTQWTDLKPFLVSQITGSGFESLWSILPWTEHLVAAITAGKNIVAEVKSMFGWDSDLQPVINEFIALRKEKPFDIKKVEEWMVSHWINHVVEETNIEDNNIEGNNIDIEDNNIEGNKLDDNVERMISLSPVFTSVWVLRNPKTGTTLCSRTAYTDAKNLFELTRERWNAFDVMRSTSKKFNKSIVSELYKEKTESVDININAIATQEDMGNSAYLNSIAWDNNVVDLYVTSGSVYWHRATMFRIWDQWFVIDPYYKGRQPGEPKDKPTTIESYTKSMQEWRTKREFMRMDFYKSDSLDDKIANIANNQNTLPTAA